MFTYTEAFIQKHRKLARQCGTFPIAQRLKKLGVPLDMALEILAARSAVAK